ncbi:MAG TPA: SEC-C metal-binding domain-containing protein [Tepidisphaeraceae bacterium]|nr:SEC-C metal-binding domain-containing protein [Tepidisphaeraceae bacterium]
MNFNKVFIKIFGSRNERLLKRYWRMVDAINDLEPSIVGLTDERLRERTIELHEGLLDKKLTREQVMPEAFAIIREAMDRNIGIRQIFNPDPGEFTAKFDPGQLDPQARQLYDEVQQRLISTGEPYLKVPMPIELYNAVRKLYPESRPPFRARCFDVQLIGGMVLFDGRIAEMATGEGKTFVAPLACFMKVLEGYHCHVVTVNDYLVRRDAMWVRQAFEALGLSVGFIQQDMEPGGDTRRNQYLADITYGTNSEFGFDYLRDNMKERVDLQVQGALDYAIVDEVDSILIDEARTPLIISGFARDDAPKYKAADDVACKVIDLNKPWDLAEKAVDAAKRAIKGAEGDMDKAKAKDEKEAARKRREQGEQQLAEAEKKKEGFTQYYEVEWDRKSVHLTHEGIAKAQDFAGVGSFYVGNNMDWPHLMEQSMRAHVVYERDKDYVVERGPKGDMEVVIVDEYTGRKMVGRQWSDGLHQAVEAKEKVTIKNETQTLATITLQNFFKLYKSLAGMTGTAQTEAEEFSKIYKLEVVTIPTNRPVVRLDNEDRVYRKEAEKWTAIIDEIKEESDKGRPVLVGTTSVEKSEMISRMLTRQCGVEHEVLNAKQHEREAHIVAKAGQQHVNVHSEKVGNVTIATNMAGRGTDIKLSPEAHQSGGLHVIGTERHTARRIDNQLRGRGGRQGDPGSSRFYVSLQDELMKMFAGEWVIKVLGFLGMEEGMAIEDKRITKGIVRAQKKVEERNFLARKNLLDYDEVMDYQRTSFYGMRQQVLEGRHVDQVIWRMIGESIEDAVKKYITEDYVAGTIAEWAKNNFEINVDAEDLRGNREIDHIEEYIKDQARAEAETTISSTLEEFMGEGDSDNTDSWDTRGLSSWAMSRFSVSLPQSQIRQMTATQVAQRLRDTAIEQIEKRDVNGVLKFLEPLYAEKELCAWAKEKFNIEVKPDEMMIAGAGEHDRKPAEEIVTLIETRAKEAYARRELEYPVDHMLAFAFGNTEGPAVENPYAADYVRAWTRAKFGIEISLEHVRATPIRLLRDELIGYQEQFLKDGKLDAEIDRILASAGSDEEKLAAAFTNRFGALLEPEEIGRKISLVDAEAQRDGQVKETARDKMLRRARQLLRQELTDLEQFVLIQIFDQTWKDHLYAMDMLRGGVGLAGFAEQDPRIVFKKEGYAYFEQMMSGIRDKVTDLIFRARVVGQAESRSQYREVAAVHEDTGGYGVTENKKALEGVESGKTLDEPLPGGLQVAEIPHKVATIVRDAPKVGRNDPCPCGSGKKYKKCHGAEAA